MKLHTYQDTLSEDIEQAPMLCYPKKTDSWDVKELRTIVPIDYEANHTYKHIIREAIISAIKHRQIAPEQYSRSQCSTVAHGINQILVFYYQRYLQQLFYLACSDLKYFYDKIVHSPSSLALQHLGIPLLSIISMLVTI